MKIKVNYITYFFLLLLVITGNFKYIFLFGSIILIHEFGHIFISLFFNYKIIKLEIFPFGGYLHLNKKIDEKLIKEIILALFGIVFQLIYIFIIIFIYKIGYISDFNMRFVIKYNLYIIMFNLMPINPLDGYKFLRSILEYKLSIKKSFIITNIISFATICLLVYYNIKYKFSNYFVYSFLLYKIYDDIKNYKYYYNNFLLEKYLYNNRFYKIKNINNYQQFYKNKYHYYKSNNKLLNEDDYLKELFDNKGYF